MVIPVDNLSGSTLIMVSLSVLGGGVSSGFLFGCFLTTLNNPQSLSVGDIFTTNSLIK